MATNSLVTIGASGIATSPTRTKISIRDLTTVIDEPESRGGSNTGPSPTEMLLASLAGATTIIGHRIAESIGLDITYISVSVEGDFDRRGVTLREPVQIPFPEVRSTVQLAVNGDESLIRKFQHDLEKYCPVTNLFRQAGSRLTVEWNMQAME